MPSIVAAKKTYLYNCWHRKILISNYKFYPNFTAHKNY
jgi:hypothetical protein